MLPFAVCSAIGGTICTVALVAYFFVSLSGKMRKGSAEHELSVHSGPQVLGCAKQKRTRKKRLPTEWQHEDLEANSMDLEGERNSGQALKFA